MLTNIEELTKKLALRLSQLSIAMCSLFAMLILTDIKYGFFRQMPLRSATGIGKMTGSVALLVGGIACLYYVLREIYIRSKRKKFFLHVELENSIKKSIQIFRHIHPFCGVLVYLLVVGHAYILWYVVGKTGPLAIYSGLFALLVLGFVTAMGISIVNKPNYLQMRNYHRTLTGVLIISVMIHLLIR